MIPKDNKQQKDSGMNPVRGRTVKHITQAVHSYEDGYPDPMLFEEEEDDDLPDNTDDSLDE